VITMLTLKRISISGITIDIITDIILLNNFVVCLRGLRSIIINRHNTVCIILIILSYQTLNQSPLALKPVNQDLVF